MVDIVGQSSKDWGKPELTYKFRPGKQRTQGRSKSVIATASVDKNKKPVIYVWQPDKFNVHVREHELYHTKHSAHKKNETVADVMKEELKAERYANNKVFGRKELGTPQAMELIERTYNMSKKNASPDIAKQFKFEEFIEVGKGKDGFKSLGFTDDEVKRGIKALKEGKDKQYKAKVYATNYHTGKTVQADVSKVASNKYELYSQLKNDIEYGGAIKNQRDWYLVDVDILKSSPLKTKKGGWAKRRAMRRSYHCGTGISRIR